MHILRTKIFININVYAIMVIWKILGGLSILAGFFFVFLFPDWKEFQTDQFTLTGIGLGIFLILLGIYLLRI